MKEQCFLKVVVQLPLLKYYIYYPDWEISCHETVNENQKHCLSCVEGNHPEYNYGETDDGKDKSSPRMWISAFCLSYDVLFSNLFMVNFLACWCFWI